MFCPKCGKEIKDGANFCPSCGNILSSNQSTLPLWPENPERQSINQKTTGTQNDGTSQKSVETIPFDSFSEREYESDFNELETKKSKATIVIPGIIIAIIVIAVIIVVLLMNRNSKTEYEERMSQGHEYMISLEYEKAVNAYEAAIKLDGRVKDAYMELADVYVKMGKPMVAVQLLEEAKEKIEDPDERAILNKKKEGIAEKTDLVYEDDINSASEQEIQEATPVIKITIAPEVTPTPMPTVTPTPSPSPEPTPTEAPVWVGYKDYDAKNRIKSLVASSTLVEENFDHKVLNVFSDNREYCWCEGVKGTGVGEYIEIMFDDDIYISRLNIFNGYSKSEKSYNNNGKAEIIRISYNGGYIDVQLNNLTWKDVKNNEFTDSVYFEEPIYTDFVRIEIRSATKGAKFEDTCISKIGIKALGSKSDRKINTGFFD